MRSRAVDGFSLDFEIHGEGSTTAVLLHGWPGGRQDYRELIPLLAADLRLIVPDLRGFGASDRHLLEPADFYSAAAQARSVAGLLEETGAEQSILVGYDIGSRIAQSLARTRPELLRGIVISPPLPGIGQRVLAVDPQREFWYQNFHQLSVSTELLDGNPTAIASYLRHFWQHWSGPEYRIDEEAFAELVQSYSAPGAFTASIGWYRAGSAAIASSLAEQVPAAQDRVHTPTTVLWPTADPLFPFAWSDRVAEFFSQATIQRVEGAGHFAPLEYPQLLAQAVLAAAGNPT